MGYTKDYMFDIQEDIRWICCKYDLPLECLEEGYDSLYEIRLSFNDWKFTFRLSFHSFNKCFGCYISVYDDQFMIDGVSLESILSPESCNKVLFPDLKLLIEKNFPNEQKGNSDCYAMISWSESNLLALIMTIQSYFINMFSSKTKKVTISYS